MTDYIIPDGYAAAGGACAKGAYAAALVLEDCDAPFAGKAEEGYEREVAHATPWIAAAVARPRRLVAALPTGGSWTTRPLAEAERIDGPACPKETVESPVIAWTQRDAGIWRLRVFHQDGIHTVTESPHILRHPIVVSVVGGLLIGCESDEADGGAAMALYDEMGAQVFRTAGRRGKLAALPNGSALLLVERNTADAIWLEALEVCDGHVVRRVEIRGPLDYTFNADIAALPDGTACIAAECAVSFGDDCSLGLHREIRVWLLRPGAEAAEPFPDETHAVLPVERRAFKSGMGDSVENLPPIRPCVLCVDGQPAVCFLQFRYRGFKTFGWDIWSSVPRTTGWTPPVRLTEHYGMPDSGYAVIPSHGQLFGILPECENEGKSSPSRAHRVALRALSPVGQRVEIPAEQQGAYRTPERRVNIAPDPPSLPAAPAEFTLLWGDMHQHTIYSKCMAAVDGPPDESLRFQRDVLGCQVIGLTEHGNFMSATEFAWAYDRLELEAGTGRIVLYGSEPGANPGRHTNWHAIDRTVFETLRVINSSHQRRRLDDYRHALEVFPNGEVVALRHHHGDEVRDDALARKTFEPRLEIAMEAMQGRTDNLLGRDGVAGFPVAYLNHGFRLGLVGGTDHFREGAPNHYCLTGFWVREVSATGVWEALRSRRTIAVSDGKIAIWATLADRIMGEETAVTGPVRVRVSLASARRIRRATLIRDGEVLPWTPVQATAVEIELVDPNPAPGLHWYTVTAEADSAYPDPAVGHASPFFVTVAG